MRVLPAALGGVLFGFSPAMMAQALGHPNLVFNVLAPVLILLAVRIMISQDPPLRLAVLLGVTAGAQVLIGEEVLFDTGVVVVLFLLVISYPRLASSHFWGLGPDDFYRMEQLETRNAAHRTRHGQPPVFFVHLHGGPADAGQSHGHVPPTP